MQNGAAAFFEELSQAGFGAWVEELQRHNEQLASHGDFPRWTKVLQELPPLPVFATDFESPAVTIAGRPAEADRARLHQGLQQLHPWRKGPFDLFGIFIDAEWRSDQKWSRVAPHVDWADKEVLDVGCGNGYYGWRMLGAGARRVVGLEPYPLYHMQYRAIQHYTPTAANLVLAGNDQCLPKELAWFDIACSMGVLYHCRDPIGHFTALRGALKRGGMLVLETLIVEGDADTVLVPADRYAKMRNVWFLPSAALLCRLLCRSGFSHPQVVDITATTPQEQRRTDWMRFESLADFLDPTDPNRTIEGYPAPQRALVIAQLPP